jgi:Peptidase family M28
MIKRSHPPASSEHAMTAAVRTFLAFTTTSVTLLVSTACATTSSAAPSAAATVRASSDPADPPALAAIREDELRRDLFALAGDDMRGREAGTIDELRASVWVAERAREAGLEPAGEDGTYFQFFPLRRTTQSATSRIAIGGQPLTLWRDVIVSPMTEALVDAPIVWLGDDRAADAAADVAGKVAAVAVPPDPDAPAAEDALAARRYVTRVMRNLSRPLLERGAAAVVIVGDGALDRLFESGAHNVMRGRTALDEGTPQDFPSGAPVLLVPGSWRARASAADARLTARLALDSFVYPSVNVVARVPGTDPALRDEHVLFSAHQDHDGVRANVNGDSTWNGADDNATVAVAVLAIGRAFAANPGRRSALFVWHGAEEKGLWGSRWHVEHPMIPRDDIVAVLNGDMIGRNHPDTAALLGSIPPHRSSTDLVEMALDANRRITTFAIDSSWDRPEHDEGWFFRSDHLPYARANIPSLFFTTLLHQDYHTPNDDPEHIDVAKLTRMTRWMYATGWAVANTPQRPRLEPGFRLER